MCLRLRRKLLFESFAVELSALCRDHFRSSVSAVRWVPIRYHEFYDVPRLFLAEQGTAVYVFDCPFDEAADEYPAHYRVYRLPSEMGAAADAGSWEGLPRAGTFVGEVPVEAVRFDVTRRAAMDDTVFGAL